MEESYTEGVANHGGPELCVGDPRGRSAALVGVRAGRAIEPRNASSSGVPTLLVVRKATPLAAISRVAEDPARSENHGMYGNSMRENREIPRLPVRPITEQAAQGTLRRQA
jgi:hypothetical protein